MLLIKQLKQNYVLELMKNKRNEQTNEANYSRKIHERRKNFETL